MNCATQAAPNAHPAYLVAAVGSASYTTLDKWPIAAKIGAYVSYTHPGTDSMNHSS